MKYYFIYHPVGGILNHNCDTNIDFVLIGIITAPNLSDAFTRAQNDFNKEYAAFGARSTSVGDIIADEETNAHMVMGMGFKPVDTFTIIS